MPQQGLAGAWPCSTVRLCQPDAACTVRNGRKRRQSIPWCPTKVGCWPLEMLPPQPLDPNNLAVPAHHTSAAGFAMWPTLTHNYGVYTTLEEDRILQTRRLAVSDGCHEACSDAACSQKACRSWQPCNRKRASPTRPQGSNLPSTFCRSAKAKPPCFSPRAGLSHCQRSKGRAPIRHSHQLYTPSTGISELVGRPGREKQYYTVARDPTGWICRHVNHFGRGQVPVE